MLWLCIGGIQCVERYLAKVAVPLSGSPPATSCLYSAGQKWCGGSIWTKVECSCTKGHNNITRLAGLLGYLHHIQAARAAAFYWSVIYAPTFCGVEGVLRPSSSAMWSCKTKRSISSHGTAFDETTGLGPGHLLHGRSCRRLIFDVMRAEGQLASEVAHHFSECAFAEENLYRRQTSSGDGGSTFDHGSKENETYIL